MFTTEERKAIERTAESHGINPHAMLALGLTESNGRVLWPVGNDKKPPIRPEVHVFYRELSKWPNLQKLAVERGLAHPKRNGIRIPRSYSARYEFYDRMAGIHNEAAAASTSFGWGQVMGFNYSSLGLSSPSDVAEMAETLEGQTELVARFIDRNGLTPFLNNLPSVSAAERVARSYNGPKWRENNYANKLILNWKAVQANSLESSGRSVADLQSALKSLGYDPGGVDGQVGPATRAAVKNFQADNGLTPDGDAGPMTWEAIDYELSKVTAVKKQNTKDRIGATGIGVGGIAVVTELIGEAQGLKDQVFQFLSGLSVPMAYIQIAASLLVAYFVYMKFLKK